MSKNISQKNTKMKSTTAAGAAASRAIGYFGKIPAIALVAIIFSSLAIGVVSFGDPSPVTHAVSAIPNDPADDPSNTVVDANCKPAPADCIAAIKTAIAGESARPLKITFGGGHAPGTVFEFATKWVVPSQISLEGKTNTGSGRPKVKITASGTPLFNLSGSDDLSFRNFDIDANKCSTTSILFGVFANGPKNLHISNIIADNGSAVANTAACKFFYSKTTGASGDGLYIHDIEVHYFSYALQLNTGSSGVYKNIYFQDSKVTEFSENAIRFNDNADNVYIEGNEFKYHALVANGQGANQTNKKNSNPVFFLPKLNSHTTWVYHNVEVRDNVFRGRPGATASDAGGSGDLIAFRGVKGFVLERNEFYDAGEVALTATAGLADGIIRYNYIDGADYTGLQLGNTSASGNGQLVNVSTYGNIVKNAGLDIKNRLPHYVMPGIGVWNVNDTCVANNYVRGSETMGIWTHDGSWKQDSTGTRFVPINEGIFYSGNDVDGSYVSDSGWPDAGKELNYAQSGMPAATSDAPELSDPFRDGTTTTAYYDGDPAAGVWGQDAWTTKTADYPGADSDGDGLLNSCYGETDDSDPCVPMNRAIGVFADDPDADGDGIRDECDSDVTADTTPPRITLTGQSTINLTVGGTFTDPGATANDNKDGNITDDITVAGDTVDTSTIGTYTITYNVSDAAGNKATQVTRTVVVKEAGANDAPTDIDLSATSINENVAAGSTVGTFTTTDPDTGDTHTYTLVSGTGDTDNAAFTISGSDLNIKASPDYETKNSYSIRVKTDDGNGGSYEEAFTITINDLDEGSGADTTPPIITLTGQSTINLTVGGTFTDPGATANDNKDGNITDDITVAGDTVDTATAGTYTITYNVSDAAGNKATQVTRTVAVKAAVTTTDTEKPKIVYTGPTTIKVEEGEDFSDPYALGLITATDNKDGNVTSKITVGGDKVDTTKPGTYNVTYTVADQAGNVSQVLSLSIVVEEETQTTSETGDNKKEEDKTGTTKTIGEEDKLTDTGTPVGLAATVGVVVITAALTLHNTKKFRYSTVHRRK